MKKHILFVLISILSLALVGCKAKDSKTIHVIATAVPHEEILVAAKPLLEKKGYKLVITVTDDFGVPNNAVATKSADANFFQHVPFFDSYNNGASEDKKLVNVAGIHIEPIGLYSKTHQTINDLKHNDKIIISNSEPDHGRFLLFLSNLGLITLKEGFNATNGKLSDVVSNPKNLQFVQVAPEFLVRAYNNNEGAFTFINGNYALAANLNPGTDAKYLEPTDNNPYVNIVAVLKGNENEPKIKALVEVLTSETIKNFISQKYQGNVIPVK